MESFEKTKNPANFNHQEKATDLEYALFLIKHINNPCQDLSGNNIREFYLREAKKALGSLPNPEAKQLLADTINKYEKKDIIFQQSR